MTAETGAADAESALMLLRVSQQRFDLGRAAWPALDLPFEAFQRYFLKHATAAELPLEDHAGDMYLACACACGDPRSFVALEGLCAGVVARAVKSIDSSPVFVEEVLQTTRERLLVGEHGEPGKIAQYAGRASLASWLCAVAVRAAITLRRRKGEQGHEPFKEEKDARLSRGGPEFEYLRARYQHTFEDSVRVAIKQLPAKQRLLLRLNLVDGMGIDTIAAVYQVGRSTAARWLQGARNALLREARREVCAQLRLTSTELDSLAIDMRSDLQVSVLSLLAADAGTDE
jgi:RNA polymerase sigma-70 factor (ECF subfamily)